MNEMLEKLGHVATHPDLNMIDDIRRSQSDLQQEASWGEYSSAKFLFLGYLVQIASALDLHIIIVVEGPKSLEIVERFLLGKGVRHTRPRSEMGPGTEFEVSMVTESLSFGIQTAQHDRVVQTYKPPSVIIALDRSFDTKAPAIEHIRTRHARNGNLLPVVRLLVSNTSEHIERCLPEVSPLHRLRLLIVHTTRLLDVVGDLQDDALNVHEDVEELLSCLLSDNFHATWSLPPIEPLEIDDEDEWNAVVMQSQDMSKPGHPAHKAIGVQKRSFVSELALFSIIQLTLHRLKSLLSKFRSDREYKLH